MKRMGCRIVLCAVACGLLLSGCDIPDESPKLDFEIAGEIALVYLNEKYDEEFVLIAEDDKRDSILGGEKWYRGTVVRKAEEDCENPREYEVNVTFDGGEYTVVGDTFMFSYIQALAEEYLEPIIAKSLVDLEYSIVVTHSSAENPDYGFPADVQIPLSVEDLYEMHEDRYSISFYILMPLSSENDEISDICEEIKVDLETSKFEFNGYLIPIADEEYEKIIQDGDSCVQNKINEIRQYNKYEISD